MSTEITPIPMTIGGLGTPGGAPPARAPSRAPAVTRKALNRQQKAAVIVQLLLSEGAELPLASLTEAQQADLTAMLGEMRTIDRDTLQSVVDEFVDAMDSIGLTFPGGIEGALGLLDGHISPTTAARLRRQTGVAARGDPWERISGLAPERLVQVLEEESTEVGAVMLSKLSVSQAATLLGMLPGQRARELSYAISRTSKVQPETVQRIGLSLASQLDAEPVCAFDADPVERVGAILNYSRAATRDDVLEGLDETDQAFAAEVRRAIFTFANIPGRVTERDIPRVVRGIDQPVLVQALGYCAGNREMEKARDYLLDNMSKRMAEALREEIGEAGKIFDAAGEEAMNTVVGEIRRLVEAGELLLVAEEE
ncbi:flagellar motor switch protein FliG [Aliiruegeria lutimaris]|uniref:Flagellar motor switch protein FliG n=1 Tax=Aliiruegeria lutimaris TaxID=571298 RepID=A0A1G9EHQ0_9RHOB|nr:FliG C-terminal domain-containing protein [Aliiruegeria lutimaris]SDK75634.1 flagellar motor switch protein FliG [Aliiruegeria lutimaris]